MKYLLILISLSFIGCTDYKKPNVEIIRDMMDQSAIKEQDYHPNDREKSGMRVPPKGTVPRGFTPYPYKGQPKKAGEKLVNPYLSSTDVEIIDRGRINYQRYCLVCHGSTGDGKGPVYKEFQGLVKSLLTDKIKAWSDGSIYHVISDGQGVMGSYINQMPEENDRWAIVNYVRSLQRR